MVKWVDCEPIDESYIKASENLLGIRFPLDYVECVLRNNGGTPQPNSYDFKGRSGAVFSYLLNHKPHDVTNIVDVFKLLKHYLLDGIYPFADGAFGNYICFDYRHDKSKPSVVFYNHEMPSRKTAIVPICNTFTELLNLLYEMEEEELDW